MVRYATLEYFHFWFKHSYHQERSWLLEKSRRWQGMLLLPPIFHSWLHSYHKMKIFFAIYDSQVVRYAKFLFVYSLLATRVQNIFFRRRIQESFLQDVFFLLPHGPWYLQKWSWQHIQTVLKEEGCWSTFQCLQWPHQTWERWLHICWDVQSGWQ